MSTSNGKITAPVSISDVNSTLGHGSTNLGVLCQSEKINKWSKCKPVVWDAISRDNLPKQYPWYVGDNGLCGFSNIIPLDITQLINEYNKDGGKSIWTYIKPKGGSEPFRLLDFDGYYHNAIPFVYSTYPKGYSTSYSVASGSVTATFTMNMNNNADSLSISDFSYGSYSSLKDAKFTVIALEGSSPTTSAISGSKISVGDSLSNSQYPSASITFSSDDIGTWCILFCLQFETNHTGYIPIPSDSDDHYWMTNVVISGKSALNADFAITKIGYSGSVTTPLQDIGQFASGQQHFKVEERGKFEMEVRIVVNSGTYTIYNNTQLVPFIRTNPSGKVDPYTIPDCTISKIDGQTYTSGVKDLSKGEHTIYISNGNGGQIVQDGFISGNKYMGILDGRDDLISQTPLHSFPIYIEYMQ